VKAVELELKEDGTAINKRPSVKKLLQREIEAALAAEPKVPDRLTNPDPLITLTKQDLAGKRTNSLLLHRRNL